MLLSKGSAPARMYMYVAESGVVLVIDSTCFKVFSVECFYLRATRFSKKEGFLIHVTESGVHTLLVGQRTSHCLTPCRIEKGSVNLLSL